MPAPSERRYDEKIGAHPKKALVVLEAIRIAVCGKHDQGGCIGPQGFNFDLKFPESVVGTERYGLVGL